MRKDTVSGQSRPQLLDQYLQPTRFLDSTSSAVAEFAARTVSNTDPPREKARRLYYAVRDGIWYSPYSLAFEPEAYKASTIVHAGVGFCVQKAILLAAAARAVGIPSRLGYADVRNHLASDKLLALMGTDVFAFHGYTELYLRRKWVKVTPTFNRELCERFRVLPLEFDGISDAIFHPYDADNRRHMEYIRDRGRFADFPYDEMVRVMRQTYSGVALGENRPTVNDPQFER